MNFIARVSGICLSPKTEWPVIAAERDAPTGLIVGYVLPLFVLNVIGVLLANRIEEEDRGAAALGLVRPLMTGLGVGLAGLVLSVVIIVVLAFIISEIAPWFDGVKSREQALKIMVYSPTASWLAGLVMPVPLIGDVAVWVGGLYTMYLIYVGLPPVMTCPNQKAAGFMVSIVLCFVALFLVIMWLASLYFFAR
jgi:hypothetical protein